VWVSVIIGVRGLDDLLVLGLLERKEDWNYLDEVVVLGKQEIGTSRLRWLVMLKA
jgi:hypothetical protein